jgi:hypothetical protein
MRVGRLWLPFTNLIVLSRHSLLCHRLLRAHFSIYCILNVRIFEHRARSARLHWSINRLLQILVRRFQQIAQDWNILRNIRKPKLRFVINLL